MHLPFTADEGPVDRAREGDRLAFEILLQPLIAPAYRLALVMTRDPTQAEDCVQEAALRAWRARSQLRGGAEGMRSWFLAIVANECRNWLRGRWIRVLRRDTPHLATESGPIEDRLAESEDLRRALRALRPEERAVLLLRYGLDLDVETVAGVLGVRPGAARTRIHRALGRLRPHLVVKEVDDGR